MDCSLFTNSNLIPLSIQFVPVSDDVYQEYTLVSYLGDNKRTATRKKQFYKVVELLLS